MAGGLSTLLHTGSRVNTRDPGLTPIARSLPWVDARDHGALGNGSTNDSAALQAAFAAAAAGGLPCYLPAGIYIAEGLTVPTGLKVLFGDGNDASILKRRAAGTSRSILSATGLSDFAIADIGLDGNKAAQTLGANNLVLTNCTDLRLVRLQSINAKTEAGGYGGGYVLNQLPATNVTGRDIVLDRCEAYGNDKQGLAIAQTGDGITIDGGAYSQNGAGGIDFYDQGITPAADTVSNLTISGVRAERNTGSGIVLRGFYVAGLGGVRTYGHGADPIYGLIVKGCQANGNSGYGIFAQGTGLSITGNVTRGNGNTNQAGICCNGESFVIANNVVRNNIYFGIDAGGSIYGSITGNQVVGNGSSPSTGLGTGINIGACQHVECSDNVIVDSGSPAIFLNKNDSGQYWFPWDAVNISIRRNKIVNTISNAYNGIRVIGLPADIDIEDNAFVWPDSIGNNCIRAERATGKNRGNRLVGLAVEGLLLNVSATINFPEWSDTLYINTDTTPITTVQSRSASLAAGTITAVTMTNRGSGYTADFTVGVTGSGGGSGAVLTAHVTQDGRIAAVSIDNAGTGYSGTLTFDFSAGAGSGAAATGTIGVPLLPGQEITLAAYLSDFRITSGSVLSSAAPNGSTMTIANRGAITLLVSAGRWQAKSFASGKGDVFPTTITLPSGVLITSGSGSPEGVVTAPVGSSYHRTDGAAGTTHYKKTSGAGNTGWTAS